MVVLGKTADSVVDYVNSKASCDCIGITTATCIPFSMGITTTVPVALTTATLRQATLGLATLKLAMATWRAIYFGPETA